MRIELGGDVRLVAGNRVVDGRALRGSVVRRVLAVLAVEQRPVSRDELGDAVWGEDLPRTWETAFRGAVHQLRRAAASVGLDEAEVVRTAFGCYQLDPAVEVDVVHAAVDVEAAERALAAGDLETARAAAERAAGALGEPFLAGLEGEWIEDVRRRLRPLQARAVLTLSAACTACGDHTAAVAAARAAVEVDPIDERAHRQLMTAHAAAGDRSAALVTYRRCRELLADELGLVPSEQTEALRRSVSDPVPVVPITPVALPRTLDTTFALAGRHDEVAVLERAWAQVAFGSDIGAVVAISGPAGVGKSRLAAEIAVRAHGSGATVAHGRFDFDHLGAFGAFGEVLGQLGVPWPPPELGVGTPPDRGELVGLARKELAAAAGPAGLLVVLDDAHWADRPSLSLLADMAADPVPGVVVVATARDDWVPPALAEALEAIPRIDLAPLDADGTAELIGSWAGQRPSDETVEQIRRRTGGNPYFITAVLQDLADRGAVDLASGIAGIEVDAALPTTVAELVGAAVERGGPHGRSLALSAAVLGHEFRTDQLAVLASMTPGAIEATLERLVHVRVVGRAAGDPRRFRFVHALVRQSILEDAMGDDVQRLHRRAVEEADALGLAPADVLTHLLGARDETTLQHAVELGLSVADDLVDTGAPDEAVGLLHALLDWIDAADAGPSPRAAVLMALAAAEVSRDRLVEGRGHLRAAAELAVEHDDPGLMRSGVVLLRPPTASEYDPATVDVASRLLDIVEPGSRLHATVACWLSAELGAADAERAATMAGDALTEACQLGDPALHRLSALTWHLMARAFTHPEARRQELEDVLRLSDPAGKRASDLTARVFLAGDYLELGDRARAEQAVASVLDDTAGYGPTHLRWLVLRNQVMLRVLDGALDEADALLAAATEVAGALPIPEAITLPVLQQVLTRYHQHRLEELHPLVAAFDDASPPGGYVTIVRAWMEAQLELPSAAEHVDRAVEVAFGQPRGAAWVGVTAIALEALSAVGHERTEELAALIEPRSGQHAVIVTIGYLGAIDRYLGLAAASIGDRARAQALLLRAQDQHRAVGATCYLERTARELAAVESAA